MLTKDSILAASDTATQSVSVPEWGGDVYVRTISGAERDAFEAGCYRMRGRKVEQNLANIRARLCAYALADESGTPLFANPETDAAALGKKSAAVLERIWNVARTLNALNAEDVEALSKNSETGQPDASPTA